MFYQKNIPTWERLARLVVAATLIGFGLIALGMNLPGIALAAVGVFVAVTALIGFCPACALAGRRIAKKADQHRDKETPGIG